MSTNSSVPTWWPLKNVETALNVFLVRRWFHLLGFKISKVQARRQQKILPVPNISMEDSRIQPFSAIEGSAGWSSRNFSHKPKLFSNTGYHRVQRNEGTTHVWSQSSYRCRPSKYKNLRDSTATKCWQMRELLYSSWIMCKKEGREKVSADCFSEKYLGRFFFVGLS